MSCLRVLPVLLVLAMFSSCSLSQSKQTSGNYFVQTLRSDDGTEIFTVYESSSDHRVMDLTTFSDSTQTGTVFVGGEGAVTVFGIETGNPGLVDVSVGVAFPQIRIGAVDSNSDKKPDYYQIDMPNGRNLLNRYYDLDRDGRFDAMADLADKKLLILVANTWTAANYDLEKLTNLDQPSAITLDGNAGSQMDFRNGVWDIVVEK